MTNADKIRNMTDERLLRFLVLEIKDHCPPGTLWCDGLIKQRSCRECWENWLKKEVQDDE